MAGRRAYRARQARRAPNAPNQHFIRLPALAAEIVRDAALSRGDLVVDIGAGGGALTRELARVARRVVAIELDPRLASRLDGRWPNVDVISGDVLDAPLPDEPFRVVANLPFHITTAVLRRLLDDPRVPVERADLVVEWDVARKRALPWPATRLGATWGAWYEFTLARRVSAHEFEPAPAVDAAVLVVRRRERPLVPPAAWREYSSFVAKGFRRKAGARGLDAHEWAGLFSTWRSVRATR